MELKIVFKKFFSRFRPKGARASLSREASILLHWKIIICSFFIAIALLFTSSFLIYQDIKKGNFLSPDNNGVTPTSINSKLLNKTVDFFKTKSATFDEIRWGWPGSVDPSR
jgi:hypothetical protein